MGQKFETAENLASSVAKKNKKIFPAEDLKTAND